jgi:putative addiction module component (TIGR02574 family)
MSVPRDQLESEALTLPAHERARLALRLIESLDAAPAEEQAAVDRAWEDEIRRRLDEHRAGSVRPVPAADVWRAAREHL